MKWKSPLTVGPSPMHQCTAVNTEMFTDKNVSEIPFMKHFAITTTERLCMNMANKSSRGIMFSLSILRFRGNLDWQTFFAFKVSEIKKKNVWYVGMHGIWN
jgi:hypothetical protein